MIARFLPLLLVCLACQGGRPPGDGLLLDAGNVRPAVLRFYFGSYLDGEDPFEAGILTEDGGAVRVHPDALADHLPEAAPALDPNGDGRISKEELAAFVQATYAAARQLPPTLAALKAQAGPDSGAVFTVELHGVMTQARRRISVPESALRAALAGYAEHDKQLLYPTGTLLLGEHLGEDGALIETTAMRKRADGLWDFFIYDAEGRLAPATATEPRPLKNPTQCVGCHFGNRAFEPEAAFPAAAADGPHGPRALYVPDAWRDGDLVAFFDEHRKRSDHVLGLYNTLFVAKLRASGEPVPVEGLGD